MDDDPNGFGDELDIEQIVVDDQLIDAVNKGAISSAFKISGKDASLIVMLMVWNSVVND
jgi:hypothetical protein